MLVSLSVTKSVDFQGAQDEFSNVYNFTGVTNTVAALNELADRIVTLEKSIFGNDVAFRRVRIWGGEGLAPTTMLLTKDLTGFGALAPSAIYRECAVMVRWPLQSRISGFPTTNNTFRRVSRYLRKYLHTSVSHGYATTGGGAAFSPANPGPLRAYATDVMTPVAGVELCAPNEDKPVSGPQFAQYLEHRQFPRGRKE